MTTTNSQSGQFDLRLDDDWFRLDLVAGARYYVTMTDAATGAVQSRELSLYDGTGELLKLDYTFDLPGYYGLPGEPGGPARFVFTAADSGAYYLLANAGESYLITGTDIGSYTVDIQQVALDDHSDLRESGTALAVGAEVTGEFDFRQDEDWFRVDLTAGSRYYVTMTDAAVDAVQSRELSLYDGSGDLLKVDYTFDVPGEYGLPEEVGGPARFVFTAAHSGTHYLLADGGDDFSITGVDTGNYKVTIGQVALDDHSDLRESGTALAVGTAAAGQFDLRQDDDWFRLDLTAGARYYVTMTDAAVDAVQSRELSLYDGSGDLLKVDYTFDVPGEYGLPEEEGGPARFVFTAAHSGTHYLLANGGDDFSITGVDTGNYTVGLQQVALDDHSDLRESGTLLAVGGTVAGQFDFRQDDDWFRVDLNAGARYYVTMSAGAVDPAQSRLLTLHDADGEWLKLDYSFDLPGEFGFPGEEGGPARFVFTAAQSGTHYLLANASEGYLLTGNDAGGYTLSIEQVALDDHSDLRESGTLLAVGGTVAGQFDRRHDDDWFRVDLNAGARYYVTMSAGAVDPVQSRLLTLLDADGEWLKLDYSFDLPGEFGMPDEEGGPARFVFTAAQSGTHYLLANASESYFFTDDDTGGYSLSIEQVALDDHSDLRESGTPLLPGGYEPPPPQDGEVITDTSGGASTLTGTSGNDTITGGAGDDVIDGGAGLDVATWAGAAGNFRLVFSEGAWTVEDAAGGEGSDTVRNVERLQFADRTVVLESMEHGSYDDLPEALWHFFIVAFDAAPGVIYMDQLAEAWRYGLTVQEIVDIFTSKSQFTEVYPATLDNAQLGVALATNIIKDSASEAARIEAATDIQGALDIGWTLGQMIYTVFGNLGAKSFDDPTWGGTALQFDKQIQVAKFYTEMMNQGTEDLATLRSVLKPVTPDTDVSTDQALIEVIGVGLLEG